MGKSRQPILEPSPECSSRIATGSLGSVAGKPPAVELRLAAGVRTEVDLSVKGEVDGGGGLLPSSREGCSTSCHWVRE
jgi:hypothetical protein